jgi:hypothetical protein
MFLFPIMPAKAVCSKSMKWGMKECDINVYRMSGNLCMWTITQVLSENWDKMFLDKILIDSQFLWKSWLHHHFVFPIPCCHIAFKFSRSFNENCVLVEILSRNMFALMFLKELYDAVHMYDFLGICIVKLGLWPWPSLGSSTVLCLNC